MKYCISEVREIKLSNIYWIVLKRCTWFSFNSSIHLSWWYYNLTFLLSSRTVFMFSIHTASTGPSKIIHFLSGEVLAACSRKVLAKTPRNNCTKCIESRVHDHEMQSSPFLNKFCGIKLYFGRVPTIKPLMRDRIKSPVQLPHCDGLGIYNGEHHLQNNKPLLMQSLVYHPLSYTTSITKFIK